MVRIDPEYAPYFPPEDNFPDSVFETPATNEIKPAKDRFPRNYSIFVVMCNLIMGVICFAIFRSDPGAILGGIFEAVATVVLNIGLLLTGMLFVLVRFCRRRQDRSWDQAGRFVAAQALIFLTTLLSCIAVVGMTMILSNSVPHRH